VQPEFSGAISRKPDGMPMRNYKIRASTRIEEKPEVFPVKNGNNFPRRSRPFFIKLQNENGATQACTHL
jgi:hypothetical protein